MEILIVTAMCLTAGWLVNLTADALPDNVPYRKALRDSARPLTAALSRSGSSDGDNGHTARWFGVYIVATAIGCITYLRLGMTVEAGVMALYAWFLLAVAIIDLEHRRVLNRMLIGALPVVAAVVVILDMPTIRWALIGGLIGFGVFMILALLRPGGMGMGDVKLAGLIGLATGVAGVTITLTVGIISAGVAGAALMVLHRFDRKATMAYAPYLALGAWVAMFYLAPAFQGQPI